MEPHEIVPQPAQPVVPTTLTIPTRGSDRGSAMDLDRLAGPQNAADTAAPRKDADAARTNLIDSSLVLAKLGLDETVEAATGTPPNAAVAQKSLTDAVAHLEEVERTIKTAPASFDRTSGQDRLHGIRSAYARVTALDTAKLGSDATRFIIARGHARDAIGRLGAEFGAGAALPTAATAWSKDVLERVAIEAAIDMLGVEAAGAIDALEASSGDREERIAGLSTRLEGHLAHIGNLSRDLHLADMMLYRANIDIASHEIIKIRNWIHMRPARLRMLSAFQPSMNGVDRLRAQCKLTPLLDMPSPTPSQRAVEESEKEQKDIAAALQLLNQAEFLDFVGMTAGVERFKAFANLETPPATPSFWVQAAIAVGVTVIGNVTGPLFSEVLGRTFARIATMQQTHGRGEKALAAIEGVVNDSVQNVSTLVINGVAKSAVDQHNRSVRDVTFFSELFLKMRVEYAVALTSSVIEMAKRGAISEVEIQALRHVILKMSETITETTFREAAHGYTLLNAHMRLNQKDPASPISDMDNYFGDHTREHQHGVGKSGRTGVGRVLVKFVHEGSVRRFEVDDFRIGGLNEDLAHAVFERGGRRLNRMEIPMEFDVEGVGDAIASFAVDENGAIRGEQGWDVFKSRMKTNSIFAGVDVDEATYGSAEAVWRAIREQPMPSSARAEPARDLKR